MVSRINARRDEFINIINIEYDKMIEQLIEYYQKVALALKEFNDKYSKAKEKALRSGDFSKKISEKAALKVSK